MEHLLISAAIYLLVGILTGILSGLFGIGGGIILVPALSFIFTTNQLAPPTIIMHMATATSLTIAVGTTFISLQVHYRYGYVTWPLFRLLAPGVIIGALIGVSIADNLHSHWLQIFFGIFLGFCAWYFLVPNTKVGKQQLPQRWITRISSTSIGMIGALLGVSGAIITIPWLTYFGVPLRNTIAVSTACGFTIAFIASIAYIISGIHTSDLPAWSSGYVYWPAVISILATTVIVAPIATRLAYRLPLAKLQRFFGVVLLLVALRMLL